MESSTDLERLRALTGAKWQHYGPEVIPAWVADMDFPTAPAIVEALRGMVESSDFGYNGISFDQSVPQAWAEWSSRRHGWRPDLDRVRMFSNALQPIAAALSIGTVPGDGVILLTPSYPPFFGMIKGAGRRLIEYRLSEHGWRIDAHALQAVVDSQTRALILCNPHNPSGRSFDQAELETIAQVAQESDLLVISDEIWQDLVYSGGARHIPFASLSAATLERTVTVTSASKSFNLGGLSCAVAHLGHERVAAGVAAMTPHVLGGVSALGARATLTAWTQGEHWLDGTVETLRANRDHLMARVGSELPDVGVACPQATYLAWLDLRATRIASDPAAQLLERGRLALSPGADFGGTGTGFARLNFATHAELLDEIIDRLVTAIR